MRDAGVAIRRSAIVVVACGLLTALAAPIAQAAFPGENGRIVFVRHGVEDSTHQICTMVAGGAVWGCFASDPGVPSLPTWSPDGQRISFTKGDGALYTIDSDGSNLTHVRNSASQAAWSPAAQGKFVFVNLGLWTSNLDGSGAAQITTSASNLYPDWSPDGKRIVFVSTADGNYELYLFRVETGQVVRLTDTAEQEQDPDFSPDGSKILFTVRNPSFGNPQLHTMNANGGARTSLGVAGSDGAWSPDGQRIVFVRFDGGPSQGGLLFTVNADGTGETWSTPDDESATFNQPDWRPLPVNTASTHVRPGGGSPFRASLVTAFEACTAPNREHGPPLAYGSCAPPSPASSNLKVGVGDTSSSIGFVRFRVMPGDPAPPDDSDVQIQFRLSNVMRTSDLSEYTGELRASAQVRLTDRQGTLSQTTVAFPLEVDVPCVPTESTATKSLCALTTTLDAVTPGAAAEGSRAVFALDQLKVFDGGPDEDADTTADNSLFAVQGLFVP